MYACSVCIELCAVCFVSLNCARDEVCYPRLSCLHSVHPIGIMFSDCPSVCVSVCVRRADIGTLRPSSCRLLVFLLFYFDIVLLRLVVMVVVESLTE